MLPRIMGKVGQIEVGQEDEGKWLFELFLGELGGGEPESMGFFGPWDSEAIAKTEMRKAAELACEAAGKAIGGIPGTYVDMQTNQIRKWDKSDEH